MSERPILFNGEMVRAILDGRKTQTRRVMKPQPFTNEDGEVQKTEVGWGYPTATDKYGNEDAGDEEIFACWGEDWSIKAPYIPSDRLWVRETWQLLSGSIDYYNGGMEFDDWRGEIPKGKPFGHYALDYKADANSDGPWRPSIHMPRWASRITLEVVAVRVERLQDISEADAEAEGVKRHLGGWYPYGRAMPFWIGAKADVPALHCIAAKGSFEGLWDFLARPGQRRPDKARHIEAERIEPDGRCQIIARHKAGHQRLPRRLREG
jgi:hypothetical protein